MGKSKLFNEEQEKFILDNYDKMSNKAIANKFGNKYTAMKINSWLQHRDLKKNGNGCSRIFTEHEIEFMCNNYNKLTCAEIGEILGFSKFKIKGKIDHLNLESKRRDYNDRYFENIDSPPTSMF